MNEEEKEQFKNECDEWMQTLGYSLHSYNGSRTSLDYSSTIPTGNKPIIKCFLNERNEKRCQLIGGNNFKMFLLLISGELQFKHPDIKRWISAMEFYDKLAENNSPF